MELDGRQWSILAIRRDAVVRGALRGDEAAALKELRASAQWNKGRWSGFSPAW